MRYIIALFVACLILGAFLANSWWAASTLRAIHRHAAEQQGLAPGTPSTDFGVALPGFLRTSIKISHLFQRFWPVLVPLILVVCLGTAALFRRNAGGG